MKISFDFDETLSETWFQRLARAFIVAGVEVFIITSRCNPLDQDGLPMGNKDIWAIADYLGIPVEKVLFSEGGYKSPLLQRTEIDLHFDDNVDEIQVIKLLTNCHAVNLELP